MSQQTPIIIPAAIGSNPGVLRQNIPGKFYAVIDATGVFKIRVGNGSEIESKTGHYLGDDNSPEFGSITFYNYTATPITVTYYVGMVFYKPTTATAVTTVNAAAVQNVRNAPTYTKGYTYPLDASGGVNDTAVFGGSDGASLRKSFSVFNTHAANVLNILGANGLLMHVVDPRQSYVVESGSLISVKNTGGSVTTIAVCEVFYSP